MTDFTVGKLAVTVSVPKQGVTVKWETEIGAKNEENREKKNLAFWLFGMPNANGPLGLRPRPRPPFFFWFITLAISKGVQESPDVPRKKNP